MRAFVSGVIVTVLAVVPVVAVLFHRSRRHARDGQRTQLDVDRDLAKFTGELAHEIKNPLSTIKVNLKLTREALEEVDLSDMPGSVADKSSQKLASALRKISVLQKETDRLEQTLDGFLRYVRHPDLQLVRTDVNELVGDMVDFYSPQAQSHALTLRHTLAQEPLMCRIDSDALKQVILNLFINAQQAMDGGGELMVRTGRSGDRAVLQISDTGKGIAADRLPTIFRPYYSSRSGGTGLGLATAKKIVDAHHGSISVHSEPGKGTSFAIELPLVDAPSKSGEVAS